MDLERLLLELSISDGSGRCHTVQGGYGRYGYHTRYGKCAVGRCYPVLASLRSRALSALS